MNDPLERASRLLQLPQLAQDAIGQGIPMFALDICVRSRMHLPDWLLELCNDHLAGIAHQGHVLKVERYLNRSRIVGSRTGK